MSELWRPFFDLYWANRPGAPYGHNPQRVFEAGFLAGMAERAAVAKCDCKHEKATINSELIVEGERWLKYLEADNDIVTTFIADAVKALKRCRCAITSEAATT
jgi:hypothetical protein